VLWTERVLFEWAAYVWPIEDLPLIRAMMRAQAAGRHAWQRRSTEWLRANARFRRYVLRELDRRGPVLTRELDDRSAGPPDSGGWAGSRNVTEMLDILHARGAVAIVGRRNGQRLWDLADRWYPPAETMPVREAHRLLADKRYRALGVRLERGEWRAHPEATDGPIPDRVPRAADPRRRPARRPCRAAVRPQDRHAGRARRMGRHVTARRGAPSLAAFLGARHPSHAPRTRA
jgi:hypothetical protein